MFHINLKQLRKEFKISQAKLADTLGISDKTISSWESGRTEPNMKQLKQLSEYFNVSLNDLINEKNTYGDHKANLDHLSDKPELLEIYNDIYESENLQLLFDTARDLTPEELEAVLNVIKMIHKGE